MKKQCACEIVTLCENTKRPTKAERKRSYIVYCGRHEKAIEHIQRLKTGLAELKRKA